MLTVRYAKNYLRLSALAAFLLAQPSVVYAQQEPQKFIEDAAKAMRQTLPDDAKCEWHVFGAGCEYSKGNIKLSIDATGGTYAADGFLLMVDVKYKAPRTAELDQQLKLGFSFLSQYGLGETQLRECTKGRSGSFETKQYKVACSDANADWIIVKVYANRSF